MCVRIPACVTLIGLIGLLPTTRSLGAEGHQPPAIDAKAMEKMMKEFAAMVPEHARFKEMVGTWKAETKDFFANPAQPTVSEGKAVFKLLMGGRYIEQHFQCQMSGEMFEGMGITGYDKSKKKYVSIWIDNMGTGIMQTEGVHDEATNTTTEVGESDSPMGKMKMKTVAKGLTPDKYLFTMYILGDSGSEQKCMEILYTRMP